MDNQELVDKIVVQEKKIDAIYESVEKLRKYFLWTLIITVVTFFLPLIVLLFALPMIMSTITNLYGGL